MNVASPHRSLSLRLIEGPTPDIIRFLEQTVWGSSGLQYYARHYEQALSHLPKPQFFILEDGGSIAAGVMFFVKLVSLGAKIVKIAYLTQLSVIPERRGQGIAGRLVNAVVRHMQAMISEPEPTGVTAYIDEANTPSLAVFQKMGFTSLGRFYGTVINRTHPKTSRRVEPLVDKEKPFLLRALSDLYGDYILQDFETSLHGNEYTVIRDEDGILLAGLQTQSEEWQATHMEGLGGWLAIHGLSKIPWVRNHLFNPDASRFVHVGNLYARPGHEHLFYPLIEDALARHRVPFAVGYLDKRSLVYQHFAAAGSFGLLNPLMETPVRVMAWFRGIPNDKLEEFKSRPLVISPLDIS